jgi:hypothetical protein
MFFSTKKNATTKLKRRRLGQVVWRGIREKQNYMKDITWLMEPNYDTIWCKPHKHLVT